MDRRQWYREVYLKSLHWKQFRRMALINSGRLCSGCHGRLRLQVHHLTYKTLGKEKISDVMVLCFRCHRKAERIKFSGDTKTIRELTHRWLSSKLTVKEFLKTIN